jgi:hypothetical protein
MKARYTSFGEFYPYYLSQHADRRCRRAHFVGTSLALLALLAALLSGSPWWALGALVLGYGGAWIGHFRYEKNRPATFDQPWLSFKADWVMYWQMLTGKLSW